MKRKPVASPEPKPRASDRYGRRRGTSRPAASAVGSRQSDAVASNQVRVIVGGVCRDRRLAVRRIEVASKHRITECLEAIVGGGGANNAIAGMALDSARQFQLFVQVGDDDAGRWIRHSLEQQGVAMPLAACQALPTSESVIISESDLDGRGTIFTVPGARVRELPLDPIRESLAGADAFCLCGPPINTQIAALLEAARNACVPAYFTLGSAQISELSYDALEQQLASSAELVICNHHEAARLTGTTDVKAQLRLLRFGGRVRTSVVTCGADGLWGFDNLGMLHQQAYRDNRPIIDDTGAGDATAAAIIDALLCGLPLGDVLACGARNGFEACTAHGISPRNVCTRGQMDAYLEPRVRRAA